MKSFCSGCQRIDESPVGFAVVLMHYVQKTKFTQFLLRVTHDRQVDMIGGPRKRPFRSLGATPIAKFSSLRQMRTDPLQNLIRCDRLTLTHSWHRRPLKNTPGGDRPIAGENLP